MTTVISIPPKPFTMPILDFRGGINNSQPSDESIALNELSDAENYLPEQPGSLILRKRPGLTAESTDLAEDVQLVFEGKNASYFATLTKIQTFDGTDRDTGLTSSTTWDAATFEGADIFMNGTEKRFSTNGTSFADVGGSPPNFKYIEAHSQFLFGAGHSLGLLRWSAIGDKDSWSTTNALRISEDENDDLTGLIKFRDVLFVTSEKRFFHVNGDNVINMAVTYSGDEGPGCTSNRSLVVNPYGIFWWTTQGLAVSQDGINVDLPMVRKLKGTLDALNFSKFNEVHGVWNPTHDRVEYFVHQSGSSTVNLCIYYYYLLDAFYEGTGTGIQMNASGLALNSGEPQLYAGGYSANSATDQLFALSGDTDIAGNISAFLETVRFAPGGSPTSLFRAMDLTLKTGPVPTNGNLTVGAYLEDETSINSTNSFTVAAITTQRDYRIYFPRRITKCKLRVADSLATRPRIHGFTLRGRALND